MSLVDRKGNLKPAEVVAAQRARERDIKNAGHRRWKRRRLTANREWVNAYKTEFGCAHCKERDPACLDFHHRPGANKKSEVSVLVARLCPLKVVIDEIKKCIVICANCHRKHHAAEMFGALDEHLHDSQVVTDVLFPYPVVRSRTL